MNRGIFAIAENKEIADGVFRMELLGDAREIKRPGQFVDVEIDGLFLRRPISVCDWDGGSMVLIYKVVGEGTARLSRMKPGAALDLLVGLGNGFDMSKSGNRPLLLGGGVGVPPLYGLAKRLVADGKRPIAALGFNAKKDAFYVDEFRALGVETFVSTVDGTFGAKGFVTDAMKGVSYGYFYACGPEGMLRAVCGATATDGQLSFEQRMGCGFGACMGCSCKTKHGNRRICRDGPVLEKGEVIF